MPDSPPIELVVREQEFAQQLQAHLEPFLQLCNRLRSDRAGPGLPGEEWLGGLAARAGLHKRHYFHLFQAANELESYLDDHGARYNRSFRFLTELVAALRGFAQAGFRLAHMFSRFESYGSRHWAPELLDFVVPRAGRAADQVSESVMALFEALFAELESLGIRRTDEMLDEQLFLPPVAHQKLPRNVGQDDLVDEEQKIAEVASKFQQAADLMDAIGIAHMEDPARRSALLRKICTEEQARVYEATVHNLQSTYDTYIKNTVLEARDPRLPALRGYASAVLHLLEAVTELTHFHERHESEARASRSRDRLAEVIEPHRVQGCILNDLLVPALEVLRAGRVVAEDLLPSYTTLQEMEVELVDGLQIHARPAALIVGIVNHHGTPVEVEIGNRRCNAGSILEILVAVGSQPDVRRYVFRGDQHPLRDIATLFENGLGEAGIDSLPSELAYLRHR